MSGALYDLVLIAHVVAGVVGFGALAAGGFAASAARHSPDPLGEEAVRRFFKPGRDWPARLIFLVPVLGLLLLFGGDRPAAHDPWPWIGLGLWLVTAAVATARCWPAEAQAQRAFAALSSSASSGRGGAGVEASLLGDFRSACRRMEAAAGLTSICFLAAVVVMIWQP